MKTIVFILFCRLFITGQTQYAGIILDEATGLGIAFANIGLIGKPIGTVADENGQFSFDLPESRKTDSLKISAIGYQSISFLRVTNTDKDNKIFLRQTAQALEEVVVHYKKRNYKTLGDNNYTKNNCSGFADISGNWKGSETAVYIKNKTTVQIESFSFYVIMNRYADSLLFRLMLYERIPGKLYGKINQKENWVGKTFLKKPIIFKLGIKQGEFTLDLRDYNIYCTGDFFISLECLMDKMEISQFCYAGSVDLPSYFKVKAFSNWHKTHGSSVRSGGGGGEFNVRVAYSD